VRILNLYTGYWLYHAYVQPDLLYASVSERVFIGTVLYKTKSLDGTKPNTNPKTNLNSIQLFCAFIEHRHMIFKLASFVQMWYSCVGFQSAAIFKTWLTDSLLLLFEACGPTHFSAHMMFRLFAVLNNILFCTYCVSSSLESETRTYCMTSAIWLSSCTSLPAIVTPFAPLTRLWLAPYCPIPGTATQT